eukprot:1158555-Prorocentrum_minimum.AAC.1
MFLCFVLHGVPVPTTARARAAPRAPARSLIVSCIPSCTVRLNRPQSGSNFPCAVWDPTAAVAAPQSQPSDPLDCAAL